MKYDLYGTNLPASSPLFIFIHGGYWVGLSKEDSTFTVEPLVGAGTRVAVLGYDLCPSVTLEELVAEIHTAISLLLKQAGENNCPKVSICGHSAGAHLAISILEKEKLLTLPNVSLIKNVYLICGIYDLSEGRKTQEMNAKALSVTDDNYVKLSPMLSDFGHLRKLTSNLKVFVIVSEFDAPEFVDQGKKLAGILENQIDAELVFCTGLDHVDVVTRIPEQDFLITKLLLQNWNM